MGRATCALVQPDVVCHLNGGPIPMSDGDARWVVEETDAAFEVIMGGNLHLARLIVEAAAVVGGLSHLLWNRHPGGSGLTPRAMLQLLAFPSGSCWLAPEEAVATATGNVADRHGLRTGRLEAGFQGDILLVGGVRGSQHSSAWDALASGEIPGAGAVILGGEVVALPGALTPPPNVLPSWSRRHCPGTRT